VTVQQRIIGEQASGRTERSATAPPLSLPRWESFPPADRQRLVRTILHVAHRQVGSKQASGQRDLGR